MYAAGKIPGGFFKREGRATERATLTARMIDRPIRPLWPKGYRNEVQVICTVLSADLVAPHDILCINGASAALMISSLPFFGPVGAVRIGLIDGKLVVNPTLQETYEESDARPDRRRHEGRADDGRGGRGRRARADAARGARPRPGRDPQAVRGAGGAPCRRRQAEVARHGADRRARGLARRGDHGPHPGRGPARGRRDRRRARRRALARGDDGLDRGRHHPAHAGALEPRTCCSRSSGRPRSRGRCAQQFESDLRRPHRRRAGLEGAEVGEAPSALRADRRRRSSCRSRSATPGPGRRAS